MEMEQNTKISGSGFFFKFELVLFENGENCAVANNRLQPSILNKRSTPISTRHPLLLSYSSD